MIPITLSTPPISKEKKDELRQHLAKLKDEYFILFKKNISFKTSGLKTIREFLDPDEKLVEEYDYIDEDGYDVGGEIFHPYPLEKQIDRFFRNQSMYEGDDELLFKIVKIVVDLCPEFLATWTSDHREIPLHLAAMYAKPSLYKYLELFINIGLKHNIGGEKSRGCLLMPNKYGTNALEMIKHPEIFEML